MPENNLLTLVSRLIDKKTKIKKQEQGDLEKILEKAKKLHSKLVKSKINNHGK